MAFERLSYERNWTSPADFPRFEDSEEQVRANYQYHPDAVKAYINEVLLPALEDVSGAQSVGTASGPLQTVLSDLIDSVNELASGGVPAVAQCVQVVFEATDWVKHPEAGDADEYYTLTIGADEHKRPGANFGYNLFQAVAGELRSNTWGVAATCVYGHIDEDRNIKLSAPTPYDGAIVFFGL